MATTQFGEDHGLLHEVVVTGRKVGAGKEFWAAIAHNEELFARVVAFVMSFTLADKIDRDMTDWTCVEPAIAEDGEFEPVLQEFLLPGETSIGGEEMVGRAKQKGVTSGLRHAEAMLREQAKIPAEFRKYVLVFPEVWRGPGGNRRVWRLCWLGKRWYLFYCWRGNYFNSSDRLVSSRKYQ